MIIIEDTIYKTLKDYIKEKSEYSPIVVKKAPREMAKFPIVVVSEIENIYRSRTLDGLESMSDLTYSVEIYSKDGNDINKEIICQELMKLVDQIMSKKFNMRRISCQQLPNLDTDILRIGMRYSCIINDNKTRIY